MSNGLFIPSIILGVTVGITVLIIVIVPVVICICIKLRKLKTKDNTQTQPRTLNEVTVMQNQSNGTMDAPTIITINTPINFYNNGFSISDGKNGKIMKDDTNLIYFIKQAIVQSGVNSINSTCMYFEIEILDLKQEFNLLIGYSSECINEISDLNILFNCNNKGIIINKIEYPNTNSNVKDGDIIGCFYDSQSKEITFTHNGNDLYYYNFDPGSTSIFPTIYSTNGTLLKYNLGKFTFSYQRAECLKLGMAANYIREYPPMYIA